LLFSFIFLSDYSAHCSNIVWSKELVFLFYFPLLFSISDWLILSLSFFFFCFLSLLFLFFVFFFAFLFFLWKHLNQDNRSIAWKTLLLSHPKGRLEISILGQGYGKKSMFGSKGLQKAGHNVCQDICLAKWLRKMGMPKSSPRNAYNDN